MLINKNIYFVHIPRTGGRYISKIISDNYLCEYYDFDKEALFKDKEVQHLTHSEYQEFLNYVPLKTFTVVRDPINRFVSSLANSKFEKEVDLILKDQESFDKFINYSIIDKKNIGNWFVPQIDFIDYKTKIWKFEDGFGDNFFKWLQNNFDLLIQNKTASAEFFINKIDYKFKVSLTNEQKNYIKNYYYKDYKILGY
jgi:hypothetical protein